MTGLDGCTEPTGSQEDREGKTESTRWPRAGRRAEDTELCSAAAVAEPRTRGQKVRTVEGENSHHRGEKSCASSPRKDIRTTWKLFSNDPADPWILILQDKDRPSAGQRGKALQNKSSSRVWTYAQIRLTAPQIHLPLPPCAAPQPYSFSRETCHKLSNCEARRHGKPLPYPPNLDPESLKKLPTLAPKTLSAATAFNEDEDSEPEELPPGAKTRMKNTGRGGPNSAPRGKHGFPDSQKLRERNIKSCLGNVLAKTIK
ncbi:hypothetical protein HPG69_007393 [Diceros bicornis minor]|uniref:PEST proteolytic signal-containing nuclear protein n=1 Tax=Diceros bicornis minor TaxID=77932 RepID=A0A7J7E382_DICBM|nr:hypothetical protein HPG69_007393 [Diceros bicornis minor]